MNSGIPNAALTVPDELAGDIQFPVLDESLFNTEPMDIDMGLNDGDALNWTSQLPSDRLPSERTPPPPQEQPILYDDDLLDDIHLDEGPSIEVGRDAPAPRPVGEDLIDDAPKLYEDDLISINFDDEPPPPEMNTIDPQIPIQDQMATDFEETDLPPADTQRTGFLQDQPGVNGEHAFLNHPCLRRARASFATSTTPSWRKRRSEHGSRQPRSESSYPSTKRPP